MIVRDMDTDSSGTGSGSGSVSGSSGSVSGSSSGHSGKVRASLISPVMKLRANDIFGELEFVTEGTILPYCTIVASSDVVTVNVIEGYYLDVLFGYDQTLEGAFYHHLAQQIHKKLDLFNL